MMMDDEKKSEEDKEEVNKYNYWIAYPLALTSAIFFGIGNFILADIGYEEGIKTFYPQCIAATIIYLGYHGSRFITTIISGESYFDPANSAYYDLEGAFDFGALIQPLLKALLLFPISVSLLYAYIFGWYIDINIGLITGEYTASAIFFVVLFFFAFYKQKITWLDVVGLVLILIAVADISIGGEWERENEEPETGPEDNEHHQITHTEEHFDLAISTALAIVAGFIQALAALQNKYVSRNKKKLNQVQLVFDSLLPIILGTTPFFVMELMNQDPANPTYSMR